MYDAIADPYCYAGTTVLKNIPNIRDQAALDTYETALTTQRGDERLPNGHLGAAHYRAIHHHLFQDIYAWAGRYRTVRIANDGNAFCYPENIDREMTRLFDGLKRQSHLCGLSREAFAEAAAAFLSTLNAIHPFREGNGRTQVTFLTLLAARAGHPLDLNKLEPKSFLSAMVVSFEGDDGPLENQIRILAGVG